jgi:hypothetical protein
MNRRAFLGTAASAGALGAIAAVGVTLPARMQAREQKRLAAQFLLTDRARGTHREFLTTIAEVTANALVCQWYQDRDVGGYALDVTTTRTEDERATLLTVTLTAPALPPVVGREARRDETGRCMVAAANDKRYADAMALDRQYEAFRHVSEHESAVLAMRIAARFKALGL